MSLDNRRNLDFAFPAFAPGLPSVYERAGFDVKMSARSVKSGRSRATSNSGRYQPPHTAPAQFGSAPNLGHNVAASPVNEAPPPMPLEIRDQMSATPPPSTSAPTDSFPSPQYEIPPRAASRSTKPLSLRKGSVASSRGSSHGSSHGSSSSRGSSQGLSHLSNHKQSVSSQWSNGSQWHGSQSEVSQPHSSPYGSISEQEANMHSSQYYSHVSSAGSDTTTGTDDTTPSASSHFNEFEFDGGSKSQKEQPLAQPPAQPQVQAYQQPQQPQLPTFAVSNYSSSHIQETPPPIGPVTTSGPASEFLFTPTFDHKNRFSSTSSIYSMDTRRSQLGTPGISRKNHPVFEQLPPIKDDDPVVCPYPSTPTPEPDTPTDALPRMPPKAPHHARRASDVQKTGVLAHSSSSSQSSSAFKPLGPTPENPDKICRGCHQMIDGRSVYSRDGNMTGRWHRACFACSSCQASLSSEVYVLDNSPYCNACYHQSNRSVCATCREGIEGPCLECDGDDTTRYHPTCLACDSCAIRLYDVFYEAGGRTYCEAHGIHAKQARRRTTRLLMS